MDNNFNVLGVEVDKATHEDFSSRRYTLENEVQPYATERSLENISLFANSNEYKEHFPEFYNECTAIIEKAKNELKAKTKQDNGKKNIDVAKHDGVMGYFDELEKVVDKVDAIVTINDIEADKLKNAIADKRQEARTISDNSMRGVLEAEIALYEAKLNKLREQGELELTSTLTNAVGEVHNALIQSIKEFYVADGKKIDNDTMTLLNANFSLTEKEMDALAMKYADNMTMVRVLYDYCRRNNIHNDKINALNNRALNGERIATDKIDKITRYVIEKAKLGGNINKAVKNEINLVKRELSYLK